jgi:hypothetical protein
VVVALDHQLLAVERAVEIGEFLQRRDAGLDQEAEHGHLHAGLLVLLVGEHAEGFQLRDVGIVVVRDVRDQDPVAVEVGAADLLDARQRLALDGAELREVHFRPRQQAERLATAATGRRLRSGRLGARVACHHRLGEALHVFLRDAALGTGALDFLQRHPELARELAHGGRRMGERAGRRGGFVGRQCGSRRRALGGRSGSGSRAGSLFPLGRGLG